MSEISRIRVSELFGMYSYTIPASGTFSNAAIIYGDNGAGKSTLLRLVFHLLSPDNDSGHRKSLYGGDFKSLEVVLSDDTVLTAEFDVSDPRRRLVLKIVRGGPAAAPIEWRWRPSDDRPGGAEIEYRSLLTRMISERSRMSQAGMNSWIQTTADSVGDREGYLQALAELAPTVFILDADRRLSSDAVSDPDDEVELRRLINPRQVQSLAEIVTKSREIALQQSLSAAEKWITQEAVAASNDGAVSVHGIYSEMLAKLARRGPRSAALSQSAKFDSVIARLESAAANLSNLSQFGLGSHLDVEQFTEARRKLRKNQFSLAAQLLEPYVRSLEERMQKLQLLSEVVGRLVRTLNDFLVDKKVEFVIGHGFVVRNRAGKVLEPRQLSSGEQQLLMLCCRVVVARSRPSVFMIDEPEISLNIRWQRRLIQSLLDLTAGSSVQFVLASHSIELIAPHADVVCNLESQK